jgi:4-hydroxyacetophenone monooxygenase
MGENGAIPSAWVGEVLPEDELRRAVEIANIPVLLIVVFQVTGDEKWLAAPYTPTRSKGLGDHDDGGLPAAIQDEIRAAAVEAILRLQRGETPAITTPSPELTTRMMSVCMGEPVGEEYGEMMSSEIARRIDPLQAGVRPDPIAAPAGFKVVVIGTGVAGIVAAHELEQMGVDYEVISKYGAAGGTWWMNTYPGAGVDTPSYLYSFNFAKNDWRMHFELQRELQHYMARVLGEIVDPSRVRHETEVLSAQWDAAENLWRLELRLPDGSRETIAANVVISGVGSINRAQLPDIPGVESFEGVHVTPPPGPATSTCAASASPWSAPGRARCRSGRRSQAKSSS